MGELNIDERMMMVNLLHGMMKEIDECWENQMLGDKIVESAFQPEKAEETLKRLHIYLESSMNMLRGVYKWSTFKTMSERYRKPKQ